MKEGDIVRFPQLANTLETIAYNGSYMEFYEGKLAETIAEEIRLATPGKNTFNVFISDLTRSLLSEKKGTLVSYIRKDHVFKIILPKCNQGLKNEIYKANYIWCFL